MMPSTPSVSLIVPAYNSAFHLRECLASLVAQDYPDFEVILVDNGSTDETAAICRDFPEVRYVYFDRVKSSYAARNEGERHARGEVLAFFDADQTARRNYLRVLLSGYVNEDPYHVYVGRLRDDPRVPSVLRQYFSWAGATPDLRQGHIPSAAVAVPRTLFDELGGFRETMLSAGDFEFFRRAVTIAQVHVSPEVAADHYWAHSVRKYLAKEERYQFGLCHLAQAEGRRPAGIVKAASKTVGVFGVKGMAALLVPFRYPRRDWFVRWQAQVIACLTAIFRFRGIARFNLGSPRAGDLPRDAQRAPAIRLNRSVGAAPRDSGLLKEVDGTFAASDRDN